MPLSPNLNDLPRLDLCDVPAVPTTLAALARRWRDLDERIDEYAEQEADPPARLVREHAAAQRAYNEAWLAYVALAL